MENAWCAQKRGHGRRKSGGDNARVDQKTDKGHPLHGRVIACQNGVGQRSGQKHGRTEVYDNRDSDGQQRAQGQAFSRVFQVARHA